MKTLMQARLSKRNILFGSAFLAAALLFGSAQGFAEEESKAVGKDDCLACHQGIAEHFDRDLHATIDLPGKGHSPNICEACHGSGSKHVETGGKKKFIERNAPKNCLSCHTDILAKLNLQHHHPVIEGRVDCSDCHGLHGSGTRSKTMDSLKGPDERCFKCHKDVKGPYVFEHDAMREGCQACHDPHGSVQDKLLLAGQSVTCLRCHFDITTNPGGNLSGGVAHGRDASTTGAAGENYDIGRGEECVDHHRAPHGSNIWRTLNR